MKIAFYVDNSADQEYANHLQHFLRLPLWNEDTEAYSHLLTLDSEGLSLIGLNKKSGEKNRQPTRVDFLDPSLNYRQRTSGKQQGIAKAVGLNKHEPMQVLDATAGLAKDTFILASLGCQMTLLECSPLIFSLLEDGIKRALESEEEEVKRIVRNMQLIHANAEDYLRKIIEGDRPKPDVIYLDPMFPPRTKQAAVKRDISLLQEILPVNEPLESMLELAKACAVKRVVVKRPGSKTVDKKHRASFIVSGKSAYFEVYV